MISFKTRGDKRILKKLAGLPPKIQRKVISKSARTAMRPVLNAAKANAPKKTGRLKKSLRMRALKRSRKGRIGVTVATSAKWFSGDEYYGAFQEFGWKVGKRAKGHRRKDAEADTRKQVPGKHYVERAYKSHGEQALKTFLSEVPGQIEKLAKGG